MRYVYIEPEVAGGFGPGTRMDTSHGRPINYAVFKLHYVFDDWFGDEIVTSHPCFLVTEKLSERIAARGLSGVVFDSVEISRSDMFEELHRDLELPPFVWMKVIGRPGPDDFFIAEDGRLVVSERAWELIEPTAPNAVVTEAHAEAWDR